jgi:hypothetical protein
MNCCYANTLYSWRRQLDIVAVNDVWRLIRICRDGYGVVCGYCACSSGCEVLSLLHAGGHKDSLWLLM